MVKDNKKHTPESVAAKVARALLAAPPGKKKKPRKHIAPRPSRPRD